MVVHDLQRPDFRKARHPPLNIDANGQVSLREEK